MLDYYINKSTYIEDTENQTFLMIRVMEVV